MRADISEHPRVGIVGFGHYVPYLRVELQTLAEQWGLPAQMQRLYQLNGRNRTAVAAADEDTVTLAVTSATRAMAGMDDLQPAIAAVLVGSESHPYAVKPTSAIVADALGVTPGVFTADLEFACKAGSAAVLLSSAMVRAGMVGVALAIGADCPQSAPGSLLEASVGAGAAAFLLGAERIIVRVDAVASVTSDLTDFWRRDGQAYPSLVGKFSVDEGYVEHSCRVAQALMEATRGTASDFRHVIFHQPYASLPGRLAKRLGFRAEQLRSGLTASRIGNSYAASILLSLSAAIEQSQPGDRILLVAFGSGAGSDGLVLTVEDGLHGYLRRREDHGVRCLDVELGMDHVGRLTYGQYAHAQGKILQ